MGQAIHDHPVKMFCCHLKVAFALYLTVKFTDILEGGPFIDQVEQKEIVLFTALQIRVQAEISFFRFGKWLDKQDQMIRICVFHICIGLSLVEFSVISYNEIKQSFQNVWEDTSFSVIVTIIINISFVNDVVGCIVLLYSCLYIIDG